METDTIGTFNSRDEGYCIGRPRRRNYTDSADEVILPRVPRLSICTQNGIKPPRTATLFSFEWSENRIRILFCYPQIGISEWKIAIKDSSIQIFFLEIGPVTNFQAQQFLYYCSSTSYPSVCNFILSWPSEPTQSWTNASIHKFPYNLWI